MSKKKPKFVKPEDVLWTPFRRCPLILGPDGEEYAIPSPWKYYENNRYGVFMRPLGVEEETKEGEEGETILITHLSIKRHDREIIRDWRELQRIKNDLCGAELEAVELFPRESRKMDVQNQYHLYVMPEGYTFPFGYMSRDVIDPWTLRKQARETGDIHLLTGKQRPFEPGDPYNAPEAVDG